jgi:hypothetical protein
MRLAAAGYTPPSPPSKFTGLIGNGTVVPLHRSKDESA